MAKVYGVHKLTLAPGADPEEFERYAAEEGYPALDRIPGMRWRLLKGYKGDREGKYLGLLEFDSEERYRSYFPVDQRDPSEDLEALMAPISTELERLAGFVGSFADPAFTDYVVVGE